ncbi:MAG: hypothetical protein K2Z80_14540 [Xanthobacteraceae bacterium]|nr:hypothetical protein [Xanthobacteraceae bacterium]
MKPGSCRFLSSAASVALALCALLAVPLAASAADDIANLAATTGKKSRHAAGGVRPQERGAQEQGREEVDNENIFGFTEGSDIGRAGEAVAQLDGRGGFDLPGGSYSAWTNYHQLKFTITDSFRVMPYLTSAYHDISGFEELEGVHSTVFQGGRIEFRYRPLDRKRAPFGLTFSLDLPHVRSCAALSVACAD